MIEATTQEWLGREFNVYLHGADWNEVAGLYIFAYVVGASWSPLYIGKTANFRTYLPTHPRWPEAVQLGATHIHAMVLQGEAARKRAEAELIQYYQPPLNVHHKR